MTEETESPLSTTELFERLANFKDNAYPESELALAETRQTELIPLFQQAAAEALRLSEAGRLDEEGNWRLINMAVYLLAKWRAPGAHQTLLDFLWISDADRDWLFADGLTIDWPSLLYHTYAGDVAPMLAVVREANLDPFARAVALMAAGGLALHGGLERGKASTLFKDLFDTLEREPSFIWDSLCISAADLRLTELLPEVRRAFADGLCDPMCMDLENLERVMAGELPLSGGQLFTSYETELPGPEIDVAAMIQGWPNFHTKESKPWALPKIKNDDLPDPAPFLPPTPRAEQGRDYIPQPKIRRNEPCPCGSGSKYKKCCGKPV